jgi:cell division septation protein DedD
MSDEPPTDEPEDEYDEADERRSIFSSLWFRAVLVAGVIGVAGVVAMPYVLEWTRPPAPPAKSPPVAGARVTPPPAASSPAPTPAPSAATAAEPKAAPRAAPSGAPASSPSASASTEKSVPAIAPAEKPALAEKQALAKRAALDKPADKSADKPVSKPVSIEKKPAPPASPAAKATATSKERGRVTPAKAVVPGGAGTGSYWVQVGAYKEAAAAARVAARLREQGYHVEEARPAARGTVPAPPPVAPANPPSDRYEVLVSGAPATALSERLGAKGLAAEPTASGVMVKPALPLRDAIALSKDLAIDGLKVQVRRETGPAPAPAKPAPPGPSGGGDGWYRVRVGAFPDRAAALAAVRELSAKGYAGFVTSGTP